MYSHVPPLSPLYHTTVFRSILYTEGVEAAHPGCYTGMMWLWRSLTVQRGLTRTQQVQHTVCEGLTTSSHTVSIQSEGPYPTPSLTHLQVMVLPWYLTVGPYEKVSAPSLQAFSAKNTNPVTAAPPGALPEPLQLLWSLKGWQHPIQMIGPYQTPTSPTKADQLKKKIF